MLYLVAAIRNWSLADIATNQTTTRCDAAIYLLDIPCYLQSDENGNLLAEDVGSVEAFLAGGRPQPTAPRSVFRACLQELLSSGGITNSLEDVMDAWIKKGLHLSYAKAKQAKKVDPKNMSAKEWKQHQSVEMLAFVTPLINKFNGVWTSSVMPTGNAPGGIDSVRCVEVRLSADASTPAVVWPWKGPKGTGRLPAVPVNDMTLDTVAVPLPTASMDAGSAGSPQLADMLTASTVAGDSIVTTEPLTGPAGVRGHPLKRGRATSLDILLAKKSKIHDDDEEGGHYGSLTDPMLA